MRVYIDTNVLLDVMKESRENHVDSAMVLKLAKQGYINATVSTQSILDVYYIFSISEKQPLEEFKAFVKALMSVVTVASIDENNLKAAIRSNNNDFEDASLIDCASVAACDYILSSDKKMKRDSEVRVLTPTEFCNIVFKPWKYPWE